MLTQLAACANPPDVIEVPMQMPLLVQGGLSGALVSGSLPGAGQTLTRSLGDQGVSPDQVDSITLSALKLSLLSPHCTGLAGCDLSFIQSLTFSARAGPSSQPLLLGRLDNPPAQSAIEIPRESAELGPLLSDQLALEATLSPATRPIQNVELQVDAVLRVDLKIF